MTNTHLFEIKRSNRAATLNQIYVIKRGTGIRVSTDQYLQHDGSLRSTAAGGWFDDLNEVGTALKQHEENSVQRITQNVAEALDSVGLKLVKGVIRCDNGSDVRIE